MKKTKYEVTIYNTNDSFTIYDVIQIKHKKNILTITLEDDSIHIFNFNKMLNYVIAKKTK